MPLITFFKILVCSRPILVDGMSENPRQGKEETDVFFLCHLLFITKQAVKRPQSEFFKWKLIYKEKSFFQI